MRPQSEIIADLITVADAMGAPVDSMMRMTLAHGQPHGGGVPAFLAHFGKFYDEAVARCGPVAAAMDQMVPDFVKWLQATGFGDDKYMAVTLLNIADKLSRYSKPADARRRPAGIRAPKFH
jgi:hypothetical protein